MGSMVTQTFIPRQVPHAVPIRYHWCHLSMESLMPDFKPAFPDFEQRVRDSFARQSLMTTLGARMTHVAPGEVHIELPFSAALLQQQGFVHAGAITSVVDSACGSKRARIGSMMLVTSSSLPSLAHLAVTWKSNTSP